MSKAADCNLPEIDLSAVDDLSRMLQSLLDASQRSARKFSQVVERSEQAKDQAIEASLQLEERMQLGIRLLKTLEQQTARLESAGATLGTGGEDQAMRKAAQQAVARLKTAASDFEKIKRAAEAATRTLSQEAAGLKTAREDFEALKRAAEKSGLGVPRVPAGPDAGLKGPIAAPRPGGGSPSAEDRPAAAPSFLGDAGLSFDEPSPAPTPAPEPLEDEPLAETGAPLSEARAVEPDLRVLEPPVEQERTESATPVTEPFNLETDLFAPEPSLDEAPAEPEAPVAEDLQLESGLFAREPAPSFVEAPGADAWSPPADAESTDMPIAERGGPDDAGVEELLSSNKVLEGRVAEYAAQCARLEEERDSAATADQAKGRFLTAMPEEMQTPLDGLVSIIEQLGDTNLNEEQRRYLQVATSSVQALGGLIESVRDLPNLEGGGGLELKSAVFDLRKTIEDLVHMLSPTAVKKGVHLAASVDDDVPARLQGDPGRLRQVLLYVMNRAIKFAAGGELMAHAGVEYRTDVSTVIRFGLHHVGTPIPNDQLDRIFEVDEPGGGTGISLAIASQLVEVMGGEIGVDSDNIGFNIWFTITLTNHDRRVYPRLPQALLETNFGPVLDLSLSGMRIRCAKPPIGEVDVELVGSGEWVPLRAEVVWVRKIGFRKHEAGLRFLNVSPETAQQLTRISLTHRVRAAKGFD